MRLELIRTYYPDGTNGELFYDGKKICSTIELPWKDNATRISCIPEGEYEMIKRYSLKYKWHLQLKNVPGRRFILIHPANDAKKELKGCIAPVSAITSAGRGIQSRLAFSKLYRIATGDLSNKQQIFIIIKSRSHVILDNPFI